MSALLGTEYQRGIERTLELLSGGTPSGADRAALIARMAALIGAVILARAAGFAVVRRMEGAVAL